jgi:moderate conductance mechanosensitive channel
VFTVPFGEVGPVQNMSRDWVIDKFSINVDYSTDIEKAASASRRSADNIGR